MNKIGKLIIAAVFTLGCISTAQVQDTRESAVTGMQTVDLSQMDATYNQTAPLAQKLANDAPVKHSDVILMANHAGPPKYWIIASNFGRLGKLGDEDDLRCIHTGRNNLEVAKTGTHFEVELPLKDKADRIVGALGIVFNYKPSDDKQTYEKTGEQTRDEMKVRIASVPQNKARCDSACPVAFGA
jgi:iron complex outermembrane receptor protein